MEQSSFIWICASIITIVWVIFPFIVIKKLNKIVSALKPVQYPPTVWKKCHTCAEIVRPEAVKCKYCGEKLSMLQTDITTTVSGPLLCPICKRTFDNTWKRCFDCGAQLVSNPNKIRLG